MPLKREIVIEQAAAALLSEAKAQGIDLESLADSAKAGIMRNKPYTWVGAENKSECIEAVDHLLGSVK